MSHWNYRVLRYPEGDPRSARHTYGIHEVYYADDGSAASCTVEPIQLVAFDLNDLEWRLSALQEALTKPVLDFTSFFEKVIDRPGNAAAEPE